MADGTISIDVELNEDEFKSSLENMGNIVQNSGDLMINSVKKVSGSFALLPNTIDDVCSAVPNIIAGVISGIAGNNSVMTKTGDNFFRSVITNLPRINDDITDKVVEMSSGIVGKFAGFIPDMAKTGIDFFKSVITNMPDVISEITGAVPDITSRIIETITNDFGLIAETGFNLFCSLTGNLPDALDQILTAPGEIVSGLTESFGGLMFNFKEIGVNIVQGVWEGISSMASWLSSSVTGFFQGIVGGITGFLGIHSPSVLFRNKIGKNIALGVKAGIDDEMPGVIDDTVEYIKILADSVNSVKINGENKNQSAGDLIGRANNANMFEIGGILQANNNIISEEKSNSAPINVILEPTGDIRGFFDYLSVGIKRTEYLNGGIS